MKNRLKDKIEIIQVSEKTAICGALKEEEEEKIYDFTMCNPPFYDSSEVADHESGFLR